jgi:hypothetical protein
MHITAGSMQVGLGTDLRTGHGGFKDYLTKLAPTITHKVWKVQQISVSINNNVEIYLSGGLHWVLYSCHCHRTSRKRINPADGEERR